MVVASFSSRARPPSASTAQTLAWMLPPVPASEVTEPSSNCCSQTPAQQRAVPVALGAVRDDAGHLDLVHRVDHRGGAARLRERVAHRGDLRQAAARAAQRRRHQQAQQRLRVCIARTASSGMRLARSTSSACSPRSWTTASVAASRPLLTFMCAPPARSGRAPRRRSSQCWRTIFAAAFRRAVRCRIPLRAHQHVHDRE